MQEVVGGALGEVDSAACGEVTGVGVHEQAGRRHIGRDAVAAAAWP